MKTQKKQSIKVRDLKPLKDAKGGRGGGAGDRGVGTGYNYGLRRVQ